LNFPFENVKIPLPLYGQERWNLYDKKTGLAPRFDEY